VKETERTGDLALPATKAAIYVRLSDEDVSGKSLGIDSTGVQLKDAREAIAREGWIVDERHVYVDDGLSGRKLGRARWQSMLAAARRNEFSIMVVRDYDRWARIHPVDALKLIKDLADLGVKLWEYRVRQYVSVEGDQIIFTAIRARQAAAEAEKASERITGNLRARAREGRAVHIPPFGYRTRVVTEADERDGKGPRGKWWVKHEPEIAIVHHVKAVFLETESLAATAMQLNREGVRTPKGKAWRHATVGMILRQPLYRGVYVRRNGDKIPHPELRIFSQTEAARIDALLKNPKRSWPNKNTRKASTMNVAAFFVACGVCGGCIVATGTGANRSYVCDSHRLKGCRGIGYRSARAVDAAVISAVDASLTDEAIAAVCNLVREEIELHPTTREDHRGRIAAEIAATERRIGNLTEAVSEAPAGVRASLYTKLQTETDRLAAVREALVRVELAPPELDARRLIAKVQARALGLRASLTTGGTEAMTAVRAVLGKSRLKAHLVKVDGKRGWKLSGRIGGFYVFDEGHHGSESLLKKDIVGNVTGVVITPMAAGPAVPVTTGNAAGPSGGAGVPAPGATPTPAPTGGTPPHS
jgi:DNA invertase Pin-like site-specific DNA recombinase